MEAGACLKVRVIPDSRRQQPPGTAHVPSAVQVTLVSRLPLLPHKLVYQSVISKETETEDSMCKCICLGVGFPVKHRLFSSLPSPCLSLLRAEFASVHYHAGMCVCDTKRFFLWKLTFEAHRVGLQPGTSGTVFGNLLFLKMGFYSEDWQLIG